MSIPIIDQLRPLGNFPAVDASDVQAGNQRLSTVLSNTPSTAYVDSVVENKVDKVEGKGLSSNDYTTAEKNKLSGIEANANNYVHPTTAGNKHIPSGGSAGKILGWAADGTAQWVDDHNTEYSDATTSTHGLMSAADKSKLNGIETQANKTIISTSVPSTPTDGTVPSMKLVADTYASNSSLVSGLALKANSSDVNDLEDRLDADEVILNAQSARIDAIVALPEGSTTGDAELMDIRIMADGTTANSAGTAVRDQISEVKSDLSRAVKIGKQYIDKSTSSTGYYALKQDGTIGEYTGGTTKKFSPIQLIGGKEYILYLLRIGSQNVLFHDDTLDENSKVVSTGAPYATRFTPSHNGQLYVTCEPDDVDICAVTDADYIPEDSDSNCNELDSDTKLRDKSVSVYNTEFIDGYKQYLTSESKTTGKYYTGEAGRTQSNAAYIVYAGFRVKAGITYNYVNIQAYYSVFFDDTTCLSTRLNNNSSTPAVTSGSFTPTHDGTVFVTIHERADGLAMFCNGPVPDHYTQGYYNLKYSNGEKVRVEDTDFAVCNNQMLSVTGAVYGYFYNRTGDIGKTAVENYYALKPFKIKGGVKYNYSNIQAYYTRLLDLVTGTYSALSDDDQAGASMSGDYTPTHDSLVFVTIHERDYQKGMFCDGAVPSAYVEGAYNIRLNGTENGVDEVIVVDVNGSGDFTSLRAAFESITSSATVYVRNGTYDVRSYYTNEEWESNNFTGLFVPDNTTVIGESRDGVIITATDESGTVKELISTLNLANTASLKNLTVQANHIRYAVHDDWAATGQQKYTRRVENCTFAGENLKYYSTYGAGVKQGADWEFRNCKFINSDGNRGFSCHNNENWTIPSTLKLINCRFEGGETLEQDMHFGTLNRNGAGGKFYVELDGNKLVTGHKIQLAPESGMGTGICTYLTGFANNIDNDDVVINSGDAQDYSDHVDLL